MAAATIEAARHGLEPAMISAGPCVHRSGNSHHAVGKLDAVNGAAAVEVATGMALSKSLAAAPPTMIETPCRWPA